MILNLLIISLHSFWAASLWNIAVICPVSTSCEVGFFCKLLVENQLLFAEEVWLMLYLNPLTPNGLYSGRALSPLNSRTATIVATNSVLKFGGILFTTIWLISVACYAAGPLKVRLPFRSQNVPPSPPKPLHKYRDICRHLVTAFLSADAIRFWHRVLWLLLALQFTVGWNINTGLWNKNVFLTRKVVSGVLYPIYIR